MRQRGSGVVEGDLKVSATDAILNEECAFAGRGRSHAQLATGLQTRVKKRSRTLWVVENKEGENRKSSYTSGESGKGMSRWETAASKDEWEKKVEYRRL